MLQPNMVSNPTSLLLLAVCVLGIGFMVRFLIALASEENKIRVVHPFHARQAHYADASDAAFELPQHRWGAVDSGAHIALGVLRITTALTSNPTRTNRPTAAERSNVVMFAGLAEESDSAAERRYRSS